jgi:hypothetical protein
MQLIHLSFPGGQIHLSLACEQMQLIHLSYYY